MWIFMVTNSESLDVSIYKFVYEKKINWQRSLFAGYSCCAEKIFFIDTMKAIFILYVLAFIWSHLQHILSLKMKCLCSFFPPFMQ